MLEIAKLARDQRGVSMIEYCVLSAMVAVTLVFALNLLGVGLTSSFGEAHAALSAGGTSDGNTGDGNDNDNDNENANDNDNDNGDGEEG